MLLVRLPVNSRLLVVKSEGESKVIHKNVAGYIHRNLLHSYILTTKGQKEKLRKQSHLPLQQKE